jgi:signal transduction histidine kinase
MALLEEEARNAASERQRLIADVFHALSQPLTALHCSLELALYDRRPEGASRENLEAALGHAEKIAHLATGIRELLGAEDGGEELAVISLGEYLREAVADLFPVAEVARVNLRLQCASACNIVAEPKRLRQALFYLLESAISSAAAESVLEVEAGDPSDEVVALLTVERALNAGPGEDVEGEKSRELGRRLGLAIAGRIVETAGGRLQMQESERQLRLRLRIPGAPGERVARHSTVRAE